MKDTNIMKHRILGLFGGWRRRSLIAGALAVVAAGLVAMSAMAVHDEAFESTAALIRPTRPAGRRWTGTTRSPARRERLSDAQPQKPAGRLLLGHGGATSPHDQAGASRSGPPADTTTFTTSSKDNLNISAQWRCVNANNVTDKGDLVNTYAAAYVNAAGQLILYFGAEKNDARGASNLGVWFLQDPTVDSQARKEATAQPLRAVTSR